MRLVARADLGGYASGLEAVRATAPVEIEKPFVLMCGPNGSGKTAMLRMLRAATGLVGERAGRGPGAYDARGVDPAGCDDLGKLATFSQGFRAAPEPPRDFPGVLDVEALGWAGQRTWLFNARAETTIVAQGHFDDDFQHHVSLLAGKATKRSHGQLLVGSWLNAMRFALGILTPEDPYDSPDGLSPSMAALDARLIPGSRPTERWLLLDEPETALDAEALSVGLCALVEAAEIGKLRVFCASHSPLFAAGLSDHRNVQVLDFGGPRPWLEMQKRTLASVARPEAVRDTGERLANGLRSQHAALQAEVRAAREAEMKERAREIGKRGRELVVSALDAGKDGLRVPRGGKDGDAAANIASLRLARLSRSGTAYTLVLTEEGEALASHLRRNPGKPVRRARKPATAAPAP